MYDLDGLKLLLAPPKVVVSLLMLPQLAHYFLEPRRVPIKWQGQVVQ